MMLDAPTGLLQGNADITKGIADKSLAAGHIDAVHWLTCCLILFVVISAKKGKTLRLVPHPKVLLQMVAC